MTKHELAVIMAYTGVCMLEGKDFNIYLKYVEDLIGRPVFTLELGKLANEIRERSKTDFIRICQTATDDVITR